MDSLAAELSGAQQRAEELGGALEESREQCAAQQGQVAQLERALASAHQLAAAAEQQRIEQSVLAAGLRTQLEQAAAREAALQASPSPCCCLLVRSAMLRVRVATAAALACCGFPMQSPLSARVRQHDCGQCLGS